MQILLDTLQLATKLTRRQYFIALFFAGRSRILIVTTKLEGSNSESFLTNLGNIYPNITTSSRLNIGISEVKSQIIITSKMSIKNPSVLSHSVRDRIRASLKKRQTKRLNKQINKELSKLNSNSDTELTTLIDNCTNLCPSSHSMNLCQDIESPNLLSRSNQHQQFEPHVFKDFLSEGHISPLSSFDESQIFPASRRNKRFFHLCHLIEVPPITFETQESKGFLNRFHECARDIKQRFFTMLNTH